VLLSCGVGDQYTLLLPW